MSIVVEENVEVSDSETEIIGSQYTPHERERIFGVSNGDKDIEITAWGSNSDGAWEEKGSLQIAANTADTLSVGPSVYYVKLTGKVTPEMGGDNSTVDACLLW